MPRKPKNNDDVEATEKVPQFVALSDFFFGERAYRAGETFEPTAGMRLVEHSARYCKFALDDKTVILPLRYE